MVVVDFSPCSHGTWRNVFNTAEAKELFTDLESHVLTHEMHVTKEQAWARVLSRRYITALPEAEQKVRRSL